MLLERQFRYPHAREFIEMPAGKVEPGEPHLETAKRELLEETGYAAQEWTRLGVIHTAIAYTDEAIELFLARKLTQKARKPRRRRVPRDVHRAVRRGDRAWSRDGRITDAKTVTALLFVKTFAT